MLETKRVVFPFFYKIVSCCCCCCFLNTVEEVKAESERRSETTWKTNRQVERQADRRKRKKRQIITDFEQREKKMSFIETRAFFFPILLNYLKPNLGCSGPIDRLWFLAARLFHPPLYACVLLIFCFLKFRFQTEFHLGRRSRRRRSKTIALFNFETRRSH